MDDLELAPILQALHAVSNDDLVDGLRHLGLSVPDEKLSLAFSAYGLTNFLSRAEVATIRRNVIGVPDKEIERIRWRGVFIFRAYVTFLYMRSDVLERGLDNVGDESPIVPFRNFFRRGTCRDEMTTAQHIRNALAHGSFDLSSDFCRITFEDRNWRATLAAGDFMDGLCEEVFRFYGAALQAQ